MKFETFLDKIKEGAALKVLAFDLETHYKCDWDLKRFKRICENYRGSRTYYAILRGTSEDFRKQIRAKK